MATLCARSLFSGILIACLVPLIPVDSVSAERVIEASANLCDKSGSANLLGAALQFGARTEVLPIYFDGHHLGSVDCWLCQIFIKPLGTTLPSFRGLLRVEAWVFSSWGLYVTEMFLTVTSTMARCGPAFGELSGGN